jgi:hypothetical protein
MKPGDRTPSPGFRAARQARYFTVVGHRACQDCANSRFPLIGRDLLFPGLANNNVVECPDPTPSCTVRNNKQIVVVERDYRGRVRGSECCPVGVVVSTKVDGAGGVVDDIDQAGAVVAGTRRDEREGGGRARLAGHVNRDAEMRIRERSTTGVRERELSDLR